MKYFKSFLLQILGWFFVLLWTLFAGVPLFFMTELSDLLSIKSIPWLWAELFFIIMWTWIFLNNKTDKIEWKRKTIISIIFLVLSSTLLLLIGWFVLATAISGATDGGSNKVDNIGVLIIVIMTAIPAIIPIITTWYIFQFYQQRKNIQ